MFVCLFVSCNGQTKRDGVWYLNKSKQFILNPENGIEPIIGLSEEFIVIRNDSIFYSVMDTISPTCLVKSKLIKETLDFNINGSDDDRTKIKKFLEDEMGLKEKNFKGIYSLDCSPPLNKLFDFGDKFLIREYGVHYHLFEKTKSKKETSNLIDEKDILTNINLIKLPITYKDIDILPFVSKKGVLEDFDYLTDLEFIKLPNSYNEVRSVIIKALVTSGETVLILCTLNTDSELIDNLWIKYVEEIEENDEMGTLFTSFSILEDNDIVLKKEKILKRRELIETKTYKITKEGKIVEIK